MTRQLIITKKQWLAMRRYLARHAPLEACGLLAGKNDRVEKIFFIPNQAQSRVRFVMDPYKQLRAFDWIESNRMDLLAIFHSHPAGPETVSATDIAEAAYEAIHIVCARINGRWRARCFWIENKQAREISWQIIG